MGKGGVDPEYFKYKMTLSEAALYMDGLNMRDRTAWGTTRWLIWTISKMVGGKAGSPEDIIRFPWERDKDMTDEEKDDEYERMMDTLRAERDERPVE